MHTLLCPDGPTVRQTVSASSSSDSDPTVHLQKGWHGKGRNVCTERVIIVPPDIALCTVHKHCRHSLAATVDVYVFKGISVLRARFFSVAEWVPVED
jgi:hypothetical protein